MEKNRWRRIDEIFQEAVVCDPPRRAELLGRRCGDDARLRNEVESLLTAHERASSGFFELPAFDNRPKSRVDFDHDPLAGRVIGHYHLTSLIGVGGMGAVYEARQEAPQRTVAVKVMRCPPWRDDLSARLFEREGQALARLHHPGVAAIYESGRTDDGWHYFAMERVQGVPLTSYVRERALSLHDRLALFVLICEAVQYAHQRGVIHRDLKPSNILVQENGQPKILDFGLARILDNDGEVTRLTEPGAFRGTLAYASPEQMRGKSDDIDARSDVYALGVILYELLTDRPPYELAGATLAEGARIVSERIPQKAGSIRRELRGDLETIAGKALAKEPDRRYGSVAALGDDVQRYLRSEPIVAHPPSAAYQFSKFARRNKAMVGAAAFVFVVLVAGVVISTSLYVRAEGQRVRAVDAEKEQDRQRELAVRSASAESRQRAKAERIAEFMSGIFEGVSPYVSPGRDTTLLRELLDDAADRIADGSLSKNPEAELALRRTIGVTYRQIAAYEPAAKMLESAVALARSLAPPSGDSIALVGTIKELAWLVQESGHPDQAELLYEQALEMHRRLVSGDRDDVAKSLSGLASARQALGKHEQAEALFQEALEMQLRLFQGDHLEVAHGLNNLATVIQSQGRLREAEPLFEQALEMRRRLYTSDHPDLARSLNNRAHILVNLGRLKQAEPLYEQALEMRQRIFKGDHPDVAHALSNLGYVRQSLGHLDQAEPLFEQAMEMRRRLYEGDHQDLVESLINLGFVHRTMGRPNQAAPFYEQALEMSQRLFKGDHALAATALAGLALVRQNTGQLEEAELLYTQALEMFERIYQGDHPDIARSLNSLATMRRERGQFQEAESLFERALEMRQRLFKGDHPDVAMALNNVATCLLSLGRFDDALPKSEAALEMYKKLLPSAHPNIAISKVTLGTILTKLKRFSDAEPLLLDVAHQSFQPGIAGKIGKRCMDGLIELYKAWHAAEPDSGYDTKLAEWRAKREARYGTSGPATTAASSASAPSDPPQDGK